MQVEVAYALENEAYLKSFEVVKDSTILDVIRLSDVLEKYPEIDLSKNPVGIFGKVSKLDYKVRDKDRIEIYRQLIADPKEVRKRKALERKELKNKNVKKDN